MPDQAGSGQSAAPSQHATAVGGGNESAVARQQRLAQIEREATVLAEAYRLRLVGRLWWANLMLVVSPAAFATAAAIFAAKPEFMNPLVASPLAASLAGAAAVLSAIHKALRCEEYQAECVRLGTAYQRIAILASDPDQSLKDITEEFAKVAETAKAPLPNKYIAKAEDRSRHKPYPDRASTQKP